MSASGYSQTIHCRSPRRLRPRRRSHWTTASGPPLARHRQSRNATGNNTSTGAGLGFDGYEQTDLWTAGSGNYWYNPSTQSDVAWINGSIAVFTYNTGTGGTVTISNEVTAASIQFKRSGYTIEDDENGSLQLVSTTHSIQVDSGLTAAVSADIGGTSGLTMTGSGTLILSGTNNYTGLTTVSQGALNIQSDQALGGTGSGNGTTVSSGATLELQGGISVGAGETLNLTGTPSGTLRNVSGDNTYGGLLTLQYNGYLYVASSIFSDAGSLTISNTGTIGGVYGPLTLGGDGDITVASIISSATASTLTKTGTGRVTLSGSNSFTGTTTVSAGTLEIRNNSALGTTAGGTTVNSGAVLRLAGGLTNVAESLTVNGTGISNDGALQNFSDTNVVTGAITLGSAARINSNGGTLTINGNISGSGKALTAGGAGNTTIAGVIGTGSGTLTKDGSGTLTLSGSNTYTGITTISEGTLSASSIVVSGGHSNLGNATSAVVLGSASTKGTLSYTGNDATFTRGFTINAGGGEIDVTTSGQTLSIGTNGISDGGALTIGGAGNTSIMSVVSGSGPLTKTGSGTLTLSGQNTYTGGTTVNAGALNITTTGSLDSGVSVAGGTLDGGGTIDGAVAIGSSGTLSPSNGSTPTTMSTGDLTFSPEGTFAPMIEDDESYDQVDVTGAVTLTGAVLDATDQRDTDTGSILVLITNDDVDPVTGTFDGLPEGAEVTFNNVLYRITYRYNAEGLTFGDGNDVALIDSSLNYVIVDAVDAAAYEPTYSGETGDHGLFRVTRYGPDDDPLTVNFNVTGTALEGNYDDYELDVSSHTVTILADSISAYIDVQPYYDTNVEGAETVIITLSNNPPPLGTRFLTPLRATPSQSMNLNIRTAVIRHHRRMRTTRARRTPPTRP
jgi:autotransporter-associated beta strand protein